MAQDKEKKVDLSSLVNSVKTERAKRAVYGGAKPGSVELELAGKLRGEGFEGDALVVEVYKGLLGLIDPAKAKINRANEAKESKRKASK